MGHILQHLLCVHLGLDVLFAGDEYPIRERLLQRFDALVVGAHPCAVFGVVLVQEHHLQLAGLCKDVQLCQQRFAGALLRLQRKGHGLRLGEHLHLIPQLFQILLHLAGRALAGVRVAVDRQIHQHGIPGSQVQPAAAQRQKLLTEHSIEGRKTQPVVIRPAFSAGLAHQRLQFCITAQTGEMHIVDLGELVKIQKFVVDAVFQTVVPFRDEPRDRARDPDRIKILEYRYPLVALLHIEFVQELVGDDGGVDALVQMRIAEVRPLACKLGVRLKQWHKVWCKGGVSAAGLCADDAFRRELHKAQRLLRHDVHIDQNIVKHRQIRRLAARHAGAVSTLAALQCVLVIFQHSCSFFQLQCAAASCRSVLLQYTMKFDFMGGFSAQKS